MSSSRGLAVAVGTKEEEREAQVEGVGECEGTSVQTSGNHPPTRCCAERPAEPAADSLQEAAACTLHT